jgi:hypothetical protein
MSNGHVSSQPHASNSATKLTRCDRLRATAPAAPDWLGASVLTSQGAAVAGWIAGVSGFLPQLFQAGRLGYVDHQSRTGQGWTRLNVKSQDTHGKG